jgi:hypothetical protein
MQVMKLHRCTLVVRQLGQGSRQFGQMLVPHRLLAG